MAQKIKSLIILSLLFHITGFAQSEFDKIKVSDDIELIKLSDKAYLHTSYYEIQPYGRIGANGLLLIDDQEAFLFDTPWDNAQTETLIRFVADSLHAKVSTFIPNHWHEDCMGGLEYLNSIDVKSYANQMTINIAKEKGLPLPQQGFKDFLLLKLHDIKVECYYFGEGHSSDNIVVWIPSEKILFTGCMVKDMQSKGPGNLSDAKIDEWPITIKKVIEKFPSVKIVIPGHGRHGGKELLEHTLKLLNM